jgi:methionyl-tRNA synthetase
MPDDPDHVIYVWIEALMNYITALGLGEPQGDPARQRAGYWPPAYHVIGKEILWFHAVIWPAMLLALELPLPRCVYAHSFWISEGQKMSKSLGNFIDLDSMRQYVDRYGLDAWRYYLAVQGPLGATDANFTASDFHHLYNTDLVNTVGNCASRVTAMIDKYFDGRLPAETDAAGVRIAVAEHDWPSIAAQAVDAAGRAMERFDLPAALAAATGLVRRVDGFINATEPFKLAKDETRRDELGAILYQCLEEVRIASLLLWCALPWRMETLWQALGLRVDPEEGQMSSQAQWGAMEPGRAISRVALFPRIEAPAEPAVRAQG